MSEQSTNSQQRCDATTSTLPFGLDLAFFRAPPPPGRSRESRIRLDRDGSFWLDEGEDQPEAERFGHARLAEAFHGWISRHPDDGRYILCNGFDWSYFTVDGAPYFVRALSCDEDGRVSLCLSDAQREPLRPESLRWEQGRLRAMVKAAAFAGPYAAEFSRHALASLGDYLVEREPDGAPALWVNAAGEALRTGARGACALLTLPTE